MSHGPSEDGGEPASATFKLLNILPPTAQSDKDIVCDLSWEMLHDAPNYEALSYTWGTTTQDQPITIRTIPSHSLDPSLPKTGIVLVTKHLHAAILRLRQETVPRTVWIDQLCIDQHNITEKNAQVKLMADIYRRAQRTVVWLGELDVLEMDQQAIIDAAERMNFRPMEREYSTPKDQLILKDLIGFKAQGNAHDLGQRRREIFAALLSRPWFTRAWVYQEVVLAQKGIALCGSLEMDLDILINLLDGVCNLDLQERGEEASIMYLSTGYKPMSAIGEARHHSRLGIPQPKKSRWLSILWQAIGNLAATNPRDKVYAFLAFADLTEESRISPSYGKSIKSVYTDATARSIYSVGSLDVLELAIKSGELPGDLPSWVPDFSQPLPSSPFMTQFGGTGFQASRDSQYTFKTSNTELTTLKVRGHILSTVASVNPMDFQNHKPSLTLHDWIKLADVTAWVQSQAQHRIPRKSPDISEETFSTLELRILRTLLAGGAGSEDWPYKWHDSILEVYHNEYSILEAKDNGIVYPWMKNVMKIMVNKKFFMSAESDFGLAYEAVSEGDLICILQGSKTPTILRRVEAGSNHCRLVAQCYVDQCMGGEPYKERGWTNENTETFRLI
ncbi:MAG: hypothetical protein Q9172_002516 [Xanthocarpia lactea]